MSFFSHNIDTFRICLLVPKWLMLNWLLHLFPSTQHLRFTLALFSLIPQTIELLLGIYSTYHSHAQIYPLRWINSRSLCIVPPPTIGLLWSTYCVIYVALLTMTFYSIMTLLCCSIFSLMPIRPVIRITSLQQVLILFILVTIPSHEVPRSSVLLPIHLQKLNTNRLLLQLPNPIRCALFLLNLTFNFHKHLWFIATMLVLLIFAPIQFFIHAWNMWSLIFTSFVIKFRMVLFVLLMYHLKIN